MLDWLQRKKAGTRESGTLVVYTAIFGSIPDRLRPPGRARRDAGIRFVCFTDRADGRPTEGSWELRRPEWSHPDPRRAARYHKILSHVLFPDADYSIWHDGNIQLVVDPWRLVERLQPGGIEVASFKHRDRNCVYEELEACIRLDKDGVERMSRQVAGYRDAGYPEQNGLAETGVLVRRHSERVRELNQAWWREIENGSVRDQLSFDFVRWRLGIPQSYLPGQSIRSPYVRYTRHR